MMAVLQILGSLGLFLYGMRVMSDGLQKAAGDRLQSTLNFMTSNRVTAVMTGFLITALVQSSSATTVMVVSFANAGLLNLMQSIGVIFGANIGTTVTGWIVAILGFKFKITAYAIPAIAIGMPLLYIKGFKKHDWGEVIIGFGLLFLGLSFLKDSVPDIKSNPGILEFLSNYTDLGFLSFIIFVAVGTLLTVIVQSSSAAMAITITMAFSGWIDFPTAAAIVLGENIGTTVTAYLASIGTSIAARRASRAHTLFNLLGVLWMAVLFRPFLNLVDTLVPGEVFGVESAAAIPAHLALFHTLFNIINTFVFIWFIPRFAQAVEILVKPRKGEVTGKYSFPYISSTIQDTAELNLVSVKRETAKMADIVGDMFSSMKTALLETNAELDIEKELEIQGEKESFTDQMETELSHFLVNLSHENLTERSSLRVASIMRIVDELESSADAVYNIMIILKRKKSKKVEFPKPSKNELTPYLELVDQFLVFIRDHLEHPMTDGDLAEAVSMEKKINKMRKSCRKSARKRLQDGSEVRAELMYIDIVRHIEHIGDYALNIAEAIRESEGQLQHAPVEQA